MPNSQDGQTATSNPAAGQDGWRLGVDVGGTFTDLALQRDGGEWLSLKVPSTPEQPGLSTLQGVDALRRQCRCTDEDWRSLSHTHSNTVALNSLIERTGASLGLLVTAGFRDLLELARLSVPAPARYDSRRTPPLIPRRRVAEAQERMDAAGRVAQPLQPQSVRDAAARLHGLGCQTIVICFLHSYRNPAHEIAARILIEDQFPHLQVELSSEVWPQAREFERATLAVINAYIRPAVERQVALLTQGMAQRGVRTPPRGARSNGGMELLATMAERPVTALLSGPAAGVAGAAGAAVQAGWRDADLLTLDVGGTSADIGVVRRGAPLLSTEERVGGFPVLIPTVAVSAIGAGGGSIIWTDAAGTLKVGPKSTGAAPGPACYGAAGGGAAAMTDAFLLAGLLDPQQPLGDQLRLHPDAAEKALRRVGRPIGLSAEQVADGAIQVATAALAAESTGMLARRDLDLSEFRMVAYGGAGPLLAALVAEAVYISEVLIPPSPGTLSAWGAARAQLQGDFVQPVYAELQGLAGAALQDAFAALARQAATWLRRETADLAISHAVIEHEAEMRYEGQGYDVSVPVQDEWLKQGQPAALGDAFHQAHERAFGHRNDGAPVWVQELRAHLIGYLAGADTPDRQSALARTASRSPGSRGIRLRGASASARVLDRADVGAPLQGPAIIAQMDTTTLVPDGWIATPAANGALVLQRGAQS